MITQGFTRMASNPSAMPLYTSISAAYLLREYADVRLSALHGERSVRAIPGDSSPIAAVLLTWHNRSMPFSNAAFTTLAVPVTFTRCIRSASRGAKETTAAVW